MPALIHSFRAGAVDEDARLVDRALAGDEGAFRSLYHQYYNRVLAIAKGIVLDPDEADDAVQEIFTLAYRNLGRFDRRSKFSTWLFRIAVNRSIQQSRRAKVRRRFVEIGPETEELAEQAAEERHDPRVETAMAKLHPQDRAVITLFYWDELSLQEVGDTLGCSPNAAKTRLFRARERFRAAYEAEEDR